MNSSQTPVVEEAGKRFSSQSVGYLLGKPGLIALLAGLVLAAWNGLIVIVILLGLVLATGVLSKLWSRFSLVGVSCQRLIGEWRSFPGEHIELRLRLTNRKLLPLPWIQVDDEIPKGLAGDVPLAPGSRPEVGLLSHNTAMLWYTEVSWRYRLNCNKRGYYTLGPIKITSGDIFGFYPRSTTDPSEDHIIIYPRIFPIEQLDIPSLYPLGEIKAEQRIFEDPTRTIGVRDYSPRDSLRRIHWKASARHQNLQVKVFEPTTTLNVALFLAVDSFQHDGGQDEDFELGISTAASIANYVLEQHSAVGLFTNSRLADSGQPVGIPPGSSTDQLVYILEALAKVTSSPSSSFEEFLQSERRGLPWGTTIILILSQVLPSLSGLVTNLVESGYKLLVVQIGGGDGDGSDHAITWHSIRHPDELAEVGTGEAQ